MFDVSLLLLSSSSFAVSPFRLLSGLSLGLCEALFLPPSLLERERERERERKKERTNNS